MIFLLELIIETVEFLLIIKLNVLTEGLLHNAEEDLWVETFSFYTNRKFYHAINNQLN